jgi:hypothetical protein
MSWREEFPPEYAVPEALDLLASQAQSDAHGSGLIDTSWHNDVCPSFALRLPLEGVGVLIWADHPSTSERECSSPTRFNVLRLDGTPFDGAFPGDAEGADWEIGDELLATDSLKVLLDFIHHVATTRTVPER